MAGHSNGNGADAGEPSGGSRKGTGLPIEDGRAVVVYYSRTGTTRAVATDVADCLESPAVRPIRPRTERSYWNWLARSFLPGSTVPVESMATDLRDAGAVVLGTPKWTLSCPPVTEFLRQADLAGVPTGLVLTYGGFDEQRYADALADRLEDLGADLRARLLVQRDAVGTGDYRDGLATFCQALGEETTFGPGSTPKD
ncbi:MAG: hypothetical protein V5A23_08115 [Halobacteriales archaeon]